MGINDVAPLHLTQGHTGTPDRLPKPGQPNDA